LCLALAPSPRGQKQTAIKVKDQTFFASEHLLVKGPQDAGQEGIATYKDVLVQAKRQDVAA